MNLMELVHPASDHGGSRTTTPRRSTTPFSTELLGPVRGAILRARQFLIAERSADGMWVGHEAACPQLTSLLICWLVNDGNGNSELAQQCAAKLLDLQSPGGDWRRTGIQVTDLSTSVQC